MVTTDERAETESRWRQVEQLAHTRDHWIWRDGWAPGRRAYRWVLAFDAFDQVGALAEGYRESLALAFIDPAEREFLHISLQHVGFTDEVTAADADALLARAIGDGGWEPLRLTLGPLDPNPESVVLHVSPWPPVQAHRLRLRRLSTRRLSGRGLPGTDDHFWPHVTIGYVNARVPTGALLEALRRAPALASVAVTVRAIDLVELSRDDRRWAWVPVGSIPLVG